MSLKNTLTNEKLNDLYDNPFALVNKAIIMAEQGVERGEGMKSHLATDILEIIALHCDADDAQCSTEPEIKKNKEREAELV